jgi:3-oxoadipate enol-lactonase
MPFQQLSQTKLWFEEYGAKRAPPVVLLHGFPLDRRVWEEAAGELGREARVIVPDLRGFGRSISSEPFTIQNLADDVHELLLERNALPCVLAGLSMGGYVALAFAAKYGPDLAALALVDSRVSAESEEGKQGRDKMIQLAKDAGPQAVVDAMFPKMLAPATYSNRPDLATKVKTIMLNCPALTVRHGLLAMRDRADYTQLAASLAFPVQVVVGESDMIGGVELARQIHATLQNGDLAIIPDAGHLSPIEQPKMVSGAMVRFFGLAG